MSAYSCSVSARHKEVVSAIGPLIKNEHLSHLCLNTYLIHDNSRFYIVAFYPHASIHLLLPFISVPTLLHGSRTRPERCVFLMCFINTARLGDSFW